MFAKNTRIVASTLGVGAVIAAVAVTLSQPDSPVGGPAIPLAGSGSAPVNTSYVQPVTGGMNLGGTAGPATPPSTLPTSMAVPAVKAGH